MTITMPTPRRSPAVPALAGRQDERHAIDRRVRSATAGEGGVLLVEGGPGLGKSRLLDEAIACADVEGVRVGRALATRVDGPLAMAPLLSVLLDGAEPVLPRRLSVDVDWERPTAWGMRQLTAELEATAQQNPLLLCIDDLHAVDESTSAAIALMSQRLAHVPVLWVLSIRRGAARPHVTDLVAMLERHGAETLHLQPLDESAVEGLIADVLGGPASPELASVAALAGGVPAVLVPLLIGLHDEELVHVDRQGAALTRWRIPHTVVESVRALFAQTSSVARDVAVVAAVLGPSVSFEHLAPMLRVDPGTLLAPVKELLAAGILDREGDALRFRCELIRLVVTEGIVPSARRALQLQAIEVLLAAGASPAAPARGLAAAPAIDRGAVATLRRAAQALGPADPELAARLGRRALDGTAAGDDERPELASELAVHVSDGGRPAEALALLESVSGEPLTTEQHAVVALATARMLDVAPEVRIAAGWRALDIVDVSVGRRDAHALELVANLVDDGDRQQADPLLRSVIADVDAGSDAGQVALLAYVRARLDASTGHLEQARAGVEAMPTRRDGRHSTAPRRAGLLRAELLLALGDHEALDPLVNNAIADAGRRGHLSLERSWRRLRCRSLLQRGRLGDASAAMAGPDLGRDAVDTAEDVRLLLSDVDIALHIGDDRRVRECVRAAERLLERRSPTVRLIAGWIVALAADATEDAAGARERLLELERNGVITSLPVMLLDPAAAPRLVRMARRAGLDPLAAAVAATAADVAARNPNTVTFAAAAAHCRGLMECDPEVLHDAAELFGACSLGVAAASALEDRGTALARGPSADAAIEALDAALRRYAACGATWDASRVRLRLRSLGIRRRIVAPTRATSGWPSLTTSELAVVRLVSAGLTNREVAQRLFLSSHTVNMHVRHVFVKLNINSRVELARLAVDHGLS